MTAISLDAEGRAAVREIIATLVQTQAKLAPLSEALDALIDAMVELLEGDLSDTAYQRAGRAIEIVAALDFDPLRACLGRAGPVLERSLLRGARRG